MTDRVMIKRCLLYLCCLLGYSSAAHALQGSMAIAYDTLRSDNLRQCDQLLLVGDPEQARDCYDCLLYTSPSPRDLSTSRMPSSA